MGGVKEHTQGAHKTEGVVTSCRVIQAWFAQLLAIPLSMHDLCKVPPMLKTSRFTDLQQIQVIAHGHEIHDGGGFGTGCTRQDVGVPDRGARRTEGASSVHEVRAHTRAQQYAARALLWLTV